MWVRVEKVIGT
jgi:hypothetical protein